MLLDRFVYPVDFISDAERRAYARGFQGKFGNLHAAVGLVVFAMVKFMFVCHNSIIFFALRKYFRCFNNYGD